MKQIAAVLLLGLGVTACADDGPEPPPVPEGTHRTYTMTAQTLAVGNETAKQLALDIDGDGTVDNALAQAVSILFTYDQSPNEATAALIASGDLRMTIDVQTDEWREDTGVGIFTVVDGAPSANVVAGRVEDGTVLTIANDGDLVAPFGVFGTATALPLHRARVAIEEHSGDQIRGVIDGGLELADVRATLFPQFLDTIDRIIARDCDASPPPSCGCAVDADGVRSDGATYIDLFDGDVQGEPKDCQVSMEELEANTFIRSLLAPDLDRETADPTQISFGFGFEAKLVTP